MKSIYDLLLVIHILGVLGLLGVLLFQIPASAKKIHPGAMHAALLALLAGIALIGVNSALHNSDASVKLLDHTKFGVKGLVMAIILTLGYKSIKKSSVPTKTWATMLGLSLVNLIIALAW